MPTQSRKRRGRESEIAVAHRFAETIWPYAEPTGSGTPGRDVTSTPGADVEVKARRGLDLPAWLRQAAKHGDGLPILIVRPDGAGVATVGRWAFILTVDAGIELLRAAGYGEPAAPLLADWVEESHVGAADELQQLTVELDNSNAKFVPTGEPVEFEETP